MYVIGLLKEDKYYQGNRKDFQKIISHRNPGRAKRFDTREIAEKMKTRLMAEDLDCEILQFIRELKKWKNHQQETNGLKLLISSLALHLSRGILPLLKILSRG